MIISLEPEKAFDKIQYSLLIKIFSKLGIEENIFYLIIGIYEKGPANIILNFERLNTSPPTIRINASMFAHTSFYSALS